eukprot:CAMPEP_0175184430 /NCGR_PEP_ID=MMETSP0093-20121207/1361_1 /TAXON_ID=311494 /ORGANISM="Alexandrium monilatum, Strain CCMP3105" /LENGTH=181 /DNA_ID=CAMNT_0016477099 /DNA_START=156 /DNA_END=701 /DNA_ORIENTATION=+
MRSLGSIGTSDGRHTLVPIQVVQNNAVVGIAALLTPQRLLEPVDPDGHGSEARKVHHVGLEEAESRLHIGNCNACLDKHTKLDLAMHVERQHEEDGQQVGEAADGAHDGAEHEPQAERPVEGHQQLVEHLLCPHALERRTLIECNRLSILADAHEDETHGGILSDAAPVQAHEWPREDEHD